MADVNANIDVNVNTSNALAQLKSLQRQLSLFHTAVAKSSTAAASAQSDLQKNLINSINATGSFTAELRTVKTTSEAFTNSLEKNKFSMREYFRYAGASTKTFGKLFKSEFDTIGKVAEDRVKKLQTQYIKLGRDSQGAMKAISIMPNQLDLDNHSTQLQLAAQKQAIFNQLLKQGSTNLLNFGKNTQWAGRQLMVGFTLPLATLGMTASKTFMEMETAAIKFKKVYGDLLTPRAETQQALDNIQELAKQFTKYGIAVSQTVGLASEAAAAGFQGLDLQRQTTEATRLSVLGQIDAQQALETTIALQNAFKMSSEDLATSIDFLNAVENQTVTSLDDITTAIPKVAPVIQQLGGDVKDLAFFLTAMKQGGINASEGANALKSGLAALINPSAKATAMLGNMGININKIVESNQGDIKSTVIDFALALDKLDPLNRARAIEQLFGKFQFARLSTLFSNVISEGTQASRVLDLASSSIEDLASLSESELGMTAESSMNKFKKSVEDLKLALVPVGKAFLEAATPIVEFFGGILEKFGNLSDGAKKVITTLSVVIGGIGPVALMAFGLLANGIANIVKLFATLRNGYLRLTGQSAVLGEQTNYMTNEQLEAAAAAHSLNQSHANLTQTFTAEAGAVRSLIGAYADAAAAASRFAMANPGMMIPMGGRAPKKYAKGKPYVVGGSGNRDSEPAMLAPGETVIPSDMSDKYGGLINGIIADSIPGYVFGKGRKKKTIAEKSANVPVFGDLSIFIQDKGENRGQEASVPNLPNILAPLVARVGEARGLGFGQAAQGQYPSIIDEYTAIVQKFIAALEAEMARTEATISDSTERLARAWQVAGQAVETDLQGIPNEVERGTVRKALGVEEDSYGSIATNFRGDRGWGGRASRYADGTRPTSYMNPKYRKGTSAAYEMLTGSPIDSTQYDYGHVFDVKTRESLGLPTTVPLESLRSGAAPISPGALSTIENSIAKAEANAESYQKTIEEKTEDIYAASRDRSSPHPLVEKDASDDANKYEDVREKITSKRRASYRPQGAPGDPIGQEVITQSGRRVPRGVTTSGPITPGVPVQTVAIPLAQSVDKIKEVSNASEDLADDMQDQSKITQSSADRLNRLNSGMMGASFAISSLSGIASMSSGKLGTMAGTISKLTGAMFALQAVTTALTQTNAIALATQRAGLAKSAVANAMAAGPMFGGASKAIAGRAGMLGGLARVGLALKTFLGPVGLATTAATLLYVGFKKYKSVQEQARLAIEGLGDAALLSSGKVKTLGDFFGVTPTKSNLERTGPRLLLNRDERSKVDELRASESFQKDFKTDIAVLKKASNDQAKLVFDSIAMQLKSKGFAEENIDIIIKSLQEESGKTNVEFDFKSIDINTATGRKNLAKTANKLAKALGRQITKAQEIEAAKEAKSGYAQLDKSLTAITERSKALSKSVTFASKLYAGYFDSLSNEITNNNITAKEFDEGFQGLAVTIQNMPQPQAMLLLDNVLKNIPGELAQSAIGLENLSDKLLLVKAASIGVTTITPAMIKALQAAAKPGADPRAGLAANRARAKIKNDTNAILDLLDIQKAEIDKIYNKNTGPVVGSDELSAESKKYLETLKKEIDALQEKRDAQKAANDELQRQIDLQMKQQDLTNRMKQAQISGDYLGAAMLGQEQRKNVLDFNQETAAIKLDELIAKLEKRYSEIEDGAKITPKERAKIQKKAAGGYIQGFEPGGKVNGPGTATSDSIPAMLSDGEYVVKASAVSQYGVPLLHAINSQKFNAGGMVQKFGKGSGNKAVSKSWWDKLGEGMSKTQNGSLGFGIMDQIKSIGAVALDTLSNGIFGARKKDINSAAEASLIGPISRVMGSKEIPNPLAGMASNSVGKGMDYFSLATAFMPSSKLVNAATSGIKKSFVKEAVTAGGFDFPAYQLPGSTTKTVFKGSTEDLSALPKTGFNVVPTTPEGILAEALRLNPTNKNIKTLLEGFTNKRISKQPYNQAEKDFLVDMMSSVGIGDDGVKLAVENTDGFASLIASLSGDLQAQKSIAVKSNIFKQSVEENRLASIAKGSTPNSSLANAKAIDPAQAPIFHSTKYPIARNKNGEVEIYPAGVHALGKFDADGMPIGSARNSVHTTPESTVLSNFDRLGGDNYSQIVAPLSEIMRANNLKPYSANPTDMYFVPEIGKPLVFPKGSVIQRSYDDAGAYKNELVSRGLIKETEKAPLIAVDKANKEILRLLKLQYSNEDRLDILNMQNKDMYAKYLEDYGKPLQLSDEYLASSAKELMGREQLELQYLMEQESKKLMGINTKHTRQDARELQDSEVNNSYLKWAEENGIIPETHNGSLLSNMDSKLLSETMIGNAIPSLPKEGIDSLDAAMMAALHGHFKTNIKRSELTGAATGGYLNKGMLQLPKFHDWNGPVPGTYGQELPAVLKSGTEGVYQEGYINDLRNAASNTTNSASSVYNVNMSISSPSSNPKEVAAEVMRQLQVVTNKNNKTNMGIR